MAHNQHFSEGWDLPEAVPNRAPPFLALPSDLPESAHPNGTESGYDETQGTSTTGYPDLSGTTPEPGVGTGEKTTGRGPDPMTAPEVAQKRSGFWTKKKIWIAAGVSTVLMIGIGVGVGLGLSLGRSKHDGSSSDSSGSSGGEGKGTSDGDDDEEPDTGFGTPLELPLTGVNGSDSVCLNDWCAPMLSSVNYSSDPRKFMVLGLDTANRACYRDYDGTGWDGDRWTPLDGELESQPSAVAVIQGRVWVFGVEKNSLEMRIRTRHGSTFDPTWGGMAGRCYSPPAVCSPGVNSVLMLTTKFGQGIGWRRFIDGDWDDPREEEWEGGEDHELASSPVAACMDSGGLHAVAYGNKEKDLSGSFELMIKRGNATGFDDWQYVGGDFKGDPAVAVVNETRLDFVGVGKDGDMYHATWADLDSSWKLVGDDGPRSIGGGKFVSTASLLVTGSDRLDVVAVGDDGALRHRALRGWDWGDGWEDLGGFFNSAPHTRRLSDTQVAVFGIGPEDYVIHGLFSTGDGDSWGEGEWYHDKGHMSTKGQRSGYS